MKLKEIFWPLATLALLAVLGLTLGRVLAEVIDFLVRLFS